MEKVSKTSVHDDIDSYLSHLLKGMKIEKIETSAFPDVFIHLENETILHFDFVTFIQNKTDGDERNLSITVSKKNKRIFEDDIKTSYHTSGGFYG